MLYFLMTERVCVVFCVVNSISDDVDVSQCSEHIYEDPKNICRPSSPHLGH